MSINGVDRNNIKVVVFFAGASERKNKMIATQNRLFNQREKIVKAFHKTIFCFHFPHACENYYYKKPFALCQPILNITKHQLFC